MDAARIRGYSRYELRRTVVKTSCTRGKLVIVEGLDGSGKSTQLDLLHKWLSNKGYLVVSTEWNSSPIVKRTTKFGKKRRLLSPRTFSLIHAADFANRLHDQILPALNAGALVIADRWVYTAYARDAARGLDHPWLRDLYSFAVTPAIGLYFDVPLEESLNRIVTRGEEPNWYEAGMDLGLSDNPIESFRIFQGMIQKEYERVIEREPILTRIDATLPLIQQQMLIREIVEPELAGILQTDKHDLQITLLESGLSGRYFSDQAVS